MAIRFTDTTSKPAKGKPKCVSLVPPANDGPQSVPKPATDTTEQNPISQSSATLAPRKRAPNKTFDRKGYMKEYMRLYRQKAKQEQGDKG